MRTIALLSLAALSSGLAAQSNTVSGLDGRLTIVDNLTYYGRRGAAYPNGEVGMAMRNTMCNPGSVNIPWYAPMQPNHPKFGFIIARVANDRIEQINEWSYCKHAFVSVNVNGSCGTCQSSGVGGAEMGINCSDTYGAGNNASRTYLGPPEEINPWLGTWNPVGSYFDIGDPGQVGYPEPADGSRSLDQAVFSGDSVENRVTVDEVDLTTAGASYYYGIQLLHQGEAVANRHDNLAHRGFTPSFGGTSWSFSNTAEGQEYGSILDRWSGAYVDNGRNTNDDDGRIYVAVKATPIAGGLFHYEYAVHNVDYSRSAGTFRLPIDASATASNFTFGDIDTNPANDWTGAQVGNEVVFTAPTGNPIEWNTIYNFGFDANFAPGLGISTLEAARPVLGEQNYVEVPTQVPAGGTFATKAPYGTGCGGTAVSCDEAVYETQGGFDMANSGMTFDYDGGADSYTLTPNAGTWVTPTGTILSLNDDSQTTISLPFTLDYPGGSTGSLNVCSNGFISAGSNGTAYNPSVSTFLGGNPMWAALWHDLSPNQAGDVLVDSNAARVIVSWDGVENYTGSLTATFQVQFWANGDVHFIYQTIGVAGNDYLWGFSRGGASDPGSIDLSANLNSGIAVCDSTGTPNIAHDAATRPIIGTNLSLDTINGSSNAPAGLVIFGFTQVSLDVTFLGLPNCTLYTTLDDIQVFPMFGGSGSFVWPIPNNASLSGATIFTQTLVPDALYNAFGAALSNGLSLTLGIN